MQTDPSRRFNNRNRHRRELRRLFAWRAKHETPNPLCVACPACDAEPRQECRTRARLPQNFHAERVKATYGPSVVTVSPGDPSRMPPAPLDTKLKTSPVPLRAAVERRREEEREVRALADRPGGWTNTDGLRPRKE